MLRGFFISSLAAALCLAGTLSAEPLSKKSDIDFFRDVPSRNLKGLATRSDGRLVAGPTLSEIAVNPPADLLWCLEPTADPTKFLLGTGADGKIIEVTFNPADATYAARDVVKLDDPQVFSLKALPDGSILAGTSPKGSLYLVREGKVVARVTLPVDSIFDILLVNENTALVATGNPGRIYSIDLTKFATAGISATRLTETRALADRGVTFFGEVRDRNVRRIVALPNKRIVAGSSPKGNIYTFAPEGGAPVILQENRDAEVTDLLPQPNGDLYAAIVFSSTSGESRVTPAPGQRAADASAPAPAERFGGRASLVWFPANGFAETLTSRSNMAVYRIARYGDILIGAGGEQGDLFGYDLNARFSLTFAGSISAQLFGLVPLANSPGKFLVLRNNAPGLALLDFNAAGVREAETRRLDLGTPSLLGALRFNRFRNLQPDDLSLEIKVSNGTDDLEGWGPWTALKGSEDLGWRADSLRGRYARLRLKFNSAEGGALPSPRNLAALEVDRAALFMLPQNRRPSLQDFRVLSPNYGLILSPDQPPSATVALSQLMAARDDDGKRRSNFLSSSVVPSPGTQVVIWTVGDQDNDNFLSTFSIRREGEERWTDVVANTTNSFAQFDVGHLPDGVYFTRLVATETAPRPVDDRLSQTFETDDLIVDHTPPEIVAATATRNANAVVVTVRGRDRLSLLNGMEVVFNNNVRETVEQPADGVRDGREESFTLEMPLARISNATSVEVTLYDASGNGTTRRLNW